MKSPVVRAIPILNQEICTPSIAGALLPPEHAERLADQLRALADPTRLRMLDLLIRQGNAVCVCDITAQFDQRQPTISHHLRLLREAGLVDCEKRGVWAYYWVTEKGRQQLAAVSALS
ncbi:MAG: helix-turn-helix transcriptional regulator [Ktedonobacterales bacterium]|nr:helix-turn-helix transcriptional regulator [Ktedonobacterales bacterium]